MKKVLVVLAILALFACATEKGATPAKTAATTKPPQKVAAVAPAKTADTATPQKVVAVAPAKTADAATPQKVAAAPAKAADPVKPQQKTAAPAPAPAPAPAAAPAPSRDILDPGALNLARVTVSEEPKWMNPANPPDLKRLYKMGKYSIVLPTDLVPVTTRVCQCSRLFKFTKNDAWVYAFMPEKLEATALLDVDLNTVDLARARGYHDVAVAMSDGVLRMSYVYDGADDGYTRWVEIRKNFSSRKMTAFALAVKDPAQLVAMRQKFRSALRTMKPPIE
jgi:hypothetical protein